MGRALTLCFSSLPLLLVHQDSLLASEEFFPMSNFPLVLMCWAVGMSARPDYEPAKGLVC